MSENNREQIVLEMLGDFNAAVNKAVEHGKGQVKEAGGFSTLEEIRKLNLLVERRERREKHG